MEHELYHAGVKGMKWGVRNDKTKTGSASKKPKIPRNNNTTSIKTVKQKNTTTVKRKNTKTNLTNKTKRGAKVVADKKNTEVNTIVSNTVNVTTGALRVAAAFVPGLQVLNGVATATSLVGTIATLKK